MLLEGQLLLPPPLASRGVRLALGQVQIESGRLRRVVEFAPGNHRIGTPDLGGEGCLISPGFIDAHVHLPQFACIGVDGLTLLDWLNQAVFPAESRWADADFGGQFTRGVARRLVAAGTTGVVAYATVHHEATRAAMHALDQAGLRGCVGQVLMDQQAPAELLRPAKQLLAEAARFRIGEFGRIDPIVSPRFAVSCSDELLRGCGELAKRTGWAVQTHLSEMTAECALVERLHEAKYVEVYRRAGLLTNRTVLGHGIWLDDADLRALHASGSTIAHCPTANLYLQAGRFDLDRTRNAGVPTALGSDVAGGPDVSMVRVARAMIETAKARVLSTDESKAKQIRVPTAGQAFWQITGGNAAVLGWGDAGRLEEGCAADVLVIDPTIGPNAEPEWLSAVDPLGRLLYAWDDRWIARVIARGLTTNHPTCGSGR